MQGEELVKLEVLRVKCGVHRCHRSRAYGRGQALCHYLGAMRLGCGRILRGYSIARWVRYVDLALARRRRDLGGLGGVEVASSPGLGEDGVGPARCRERPEQLAQDGHE